ncbi:DUF4238 domain-containing protein [Salegentibacter salarius]|uniref:DUF4238 domain-containing protein n=1 Tax=Salegentibacter salarius TaxID=435906 RepID=A0A2N0TUT7_9FLAO|nr:DUF4238 domain-containing protein [Salegentibacter salarius]OEY72191.1 hypothetical protein BHS39_02810 [Salegentibacter salarius]PKD18512.1 hypothetical protein APR40_02810 [Salegentibacter salarius]SLJ88063.1 Protein of unknown function [Salegentibacter salarius]
MSEPIKHHYVPQIYLKRFSLNRNGDIFTLKTSTKYPASTRLTNKSKICYEAKRYTFDNKEIIERYKITDPNVIEKSRFSYENKELEELFDKIDYHKKFTKTQFERLVRIIVDIKMRNPRFSENFKNFDPKSDKVQKKAKKFLEDAVEFCKRAGLSTDIVKKAEEAVYEKYRDEKYLQNVYRAGIYINENAREELIKKLIKWDALIMKTNYENPFITSDNPGFNLNEKDQIFNTDFDSANSLVFPISPKSILILKRSEKNDLGIFKNVSYKKMKINSVLSVNKATLKNANDIIIGNSKEQLLITKKI